MRKFIREQTQERVKKLAKGLRDLRKAPGNEEALHDLRVAIRRFAQCFRTFKKSYDPDERKKLRRKLRRLMDRCGDVRDRDIAIRVLAEAGVRDAELVVTLAADRVKQQKKLSKELEHWRGWREGPKVRRTTDVAEDFASLVLPKMEREWMDAGEKAVQSESYSTLHQFRILSKRYRYTLEIFPGTGRKVEQIKKLQDYLGDINDCVATKRQVGGHAQAVQAIDELLKVREREFRVYWRKLREKRDGTLHIAARRSGAA